MANGGLERWLRWWALSTIIGGVALVGALAGWKAGLLLLGVFLVSYLAARNTLVREVRGMDELVKSLRRSEEAGDADDEPSEIVHLVASALSEQSSRMEDQTRYTAFQDRILDELPIGVLVVGEDGRVRSVNQTLRRLMPVREPAVGRLTIEAVSVVEVQTSVDALLAGRAVQEVFAAVGARDMLIEGTAIGGCAVIHVTDISQYRRAERARTDFVANVSHELRTPIAAIMGYSEMMRDHVGDADPMLRSMVDRTFRNGQRLSHLFDDLLTLYRVETRKRAMPRDRVNLKGLLEGACAGAADSAAEKGQSFEVDVDASITVHTNREAYATIVANLTSNAVKYTQAGGRIRVWAEQDDASIQLHVEDNGYGIPEAQQQRVFERFYRVDDGRSRDVGGTGLGLSICKHFALALGHHLELESTPDQGSRFTLIVKAIEHTETPRVWIDTAP